MMKRTTRSPWLRALSLLLCLCLLSVSSAGCTGRVPSDPSSRVVSAEEAERRRFDAWLDALFREEISQNILNLHCTTAHPENIGIEDYPISLGDLSAAADAEGWKKLRQDIEELEEFDYTRLTAEQQLTRDILAVGLKDSLKLEGFRLYDNLLSPLKGIQAALPTLLAEYTFYDARDVQDYLDILGLFPSLFEGMIAFAQEQADAGLLMPDFGLEKTLDQCGELIADTDGHFMLDSFNRRIAAAGFLSDTEKAQYQAENEELFRDTVVPAYRTLMEGLTALKGASRREGGLSQFENGREYYRILVRDATGSDKSVEELKSLLQERLTADFREIAEILMEHPEAYEHMFDLTVDLSDPRQVLERLKTEIAADFPAPPDRPFTVNEVPSSMEKHSSPAYYILPPIDDPDHNVIYINRSQNTGDIEDFVTLAHEGFPGHLYQTTSFYASNPNRVRLLLSFSGYAEGWGTYAEMYAYRLAGIDEPVRRLNELNKSVTFALYCLADIGIHYEGWTYDQTKAFFTGAGLDEAAAREIYETLVIHPALYLSYYVGYLEFLELRTEAEQALGDRFVLREFHEFLMKIGPAPFELIRERMQGWIGGRQAAAA